MSYHDEEEKIHVGRIRLVFEMMLPNYYFIYNFVYLFKRLQKFSYGYLDRVQLMNIIRCMGFFLNYYIT